MTNETATQYIKEAQAALQRLSSKLPPVSVSLMEKRVAVWTRRLLTAHQLRSPLPELVMRPGLPPRPLDKHYFTVVRSYD